MVFCSKSVQDSLFDLQKTSFELLRALLRDKTRTSGEKRGIKGDFIEKYSEESLRDNQDLLKPVL
jgi:hypothetical protein